MYSNNYMLLKIKDKEIQISSNLSDSKKSYQGRPVGNGPECQWCGKDIKPGKTFYFAQLPGYNNCCSISHLKQLLKNSI